MKEKILSAGIDIGTSTTQVIFSRFTIENTSGEYMVPRIEITNKEVETMALSYCSDDTAIEVSNATYNTSTFEISQFFHSVANGGYTSAVESIMTKVVSVPNLDVSGLTMSVAVQAQQIIDDYFNGV